MNSSFRNRVCLLVCFCSLLIYGQEEKPMFDEDVFGEIGFSYVLPQALGDNFVSEAYQLKNGINIDAVVVFSPKWFAGAQVSYFGTDISNAALIGAINDTRISHWHALGGYSVLNSNRVGIKTSLGIGYVKLKHKQSDTKFIDDGFSISTNISFSYRLGNSIGIYAKLNHYWDFLSIETASELHSFFRRTQIFAPSIGIKIYTF
ncbi:MULTISPECIES: hypothetical protein [Flavobacteriaceae]|uniref:hypothetical protein n=1 Tax=Flavobacteriaceae TaxID=49546 RepID=UPI001492F85F|nr:MULTISPECIES: hypothetical protein [Allomuricauda]MDC6366440.1 hypothetical protein [Muricauda sp. AC10]